LLAAFVGPIQQASPFFLIKLFCDVNIGANLSKPAEGDDSGGDGKKNFFLFSSLFYFHKLERSYHLYRPLVGRSLAKKKTRF
jgi:hypothetical protein